METIAFYSYKGGVGRSLLLANAARFLATLGNGVVALDLDFEAPGLHYKFGTPQGSDFVSAVGGAVPYLIATAEGTESPPALEAHTIGLGIPPGSGWLTLMPAGPAPNQKYWAAFKELGDRLRISDPSGRGFMAVLDLQARIAEELKPDYLLIDARTGVTELGSLATTILADTVVCMFVGNQESLDGTLTVVEALKATPRLKGQEPICIVPVLSRVTKSPDHERFASGVRRLLDLGEGKVGANKNERVLFALPHDAVAGASERVVGGERRASAFSPLYQAYLDLFATLFPSGATAARNVLKRLEAVASIRQELTGAGRERHEFEDLLPPWNESMIQEGVVYKAERGKGARYADLLCRTEAGQPLMVVEYLGDEAPREAFKFWSESTSVRCVVLLAKQQHGAQREIFTRAGDRREFRPAERWDLPRPREFELLRDVGDRSVDSMLDAVRHGHVEAAAWLVKEWEQSAAVGMHPKFRRGRWRPERAQRILDGLAATEDLRCAEEILRRASPDRYGHLSRESVFRGDFFPEEELEERIAADLFAPLFWRLPVEAVIRSMEPRRYPGETPSLAGYRLLAHELMGLDYDPDRNAIEEASKLGTRFPKSDDEDERAVMWLHRSRRAWIERVVLSVEAPPILVWEEALRQEPYWRGTLEEAMEKVGDKVKEVMESTAGLRNRLKSAAARKELATQGLLGTYEASGGIKLHVPVITAAAEVLGLSPRYLKSVVFIYLSAWALAHEAHDLDGDRGFGFAPRLPSDPYYRESPAHVTILQAFVDRLIHRLRDANLQATFEKLSKHQPEPYSQWASMRKLPLEELRLLLLKARASASALGLPSLGRTE